MSNALVTIPLSVLLPLPLLDFHCSYPLVIEKKNLDILPLLLSPIPPHHRFWMYRCRCRCHLCLTPLGLLRRLGLLVFLLLLLLLVVPALMRAWYVGNGPVPRRDLPSRSL